MGSVGELLAGLRAARVDADRAAALAARVRWRLGATEDRLRRTRDLADAVAARRFAAAITRLDLVVARLAVGGCRLDRSVAALTGEPVTARTVEPRSPAIPAEEIAQGCRAASVLAGRRIRLAGLGRRRTALTRIWERRW
ncbi:hypothetical protein [Micromonospora tarensis]|uniref:DUF222 domain-containing protein n=1 Tax=Micromonospora tarensis TaxID=2806100 RepID=A0ABS1YPV3_9ACTN|nr:hypothetical protein [Micromonospora tarensis]MBM0279473.1 hypothetical protein [Micromonospora tarensis]